ncbi:hypothetical protein [Acetomicrobium mobile]|uniref:hypothetical protein n=1 Tax=Acetomicrobium mobile TaxID=97477 RepID=UPI0026E98850|nr:hypothetical protein [Acetomicrobium mobile]
MRPTDTMNADERRITPPRWQERRNGKHGAALRKDIRHLGRSLLRAYKDDWLEKLRMFEEWADQVARGFSGRYKVKTADGTELSPQEVYLEQKECLLNHPDFKELKRRIARMDEILETFSDEELEIIELFHWGGMDYYEVAASLGVSNQTFYRRTWAIEEAVGSKWQGL